MSNFTKPVASSIGGVDFGFLSEDQIKAISVKHIHTTPTFDSVNQPIPGGLYDPALGAWGDYRYAPNISYQLGSGSLRMEYISLKFNC